MRGLPPGVEVLPAGPVEESSCHAQPFAVILSAVKDLRSSLRVNSAKNHSLSIFKTVRDSVLQSE